MDTSLAAEILVIDGSARKKTATLLAVPSLFGCSCEKIEGPLRPPHTLQCPRYKQMQRYHKARYLSISQYMPSMTGPHSTPWSCGLTDLGAHIAVCPLILHPLRPDM